MGLFDGGRRSSFGLIANAVFLTAIGCTATGMLLDRLTSGPEAPLTALFAPRDVAVVRKFAQAPLRQTTVPPVDQLDTMPTASLQRPLVINPCQPQN